MADGFSLAESSPVAAFDAAPAIASPPAARDVAHVGHGPAAAPGRGRRSEWVGVLDALRGAAALYVVGNHVSVLLFPIFAEAVSLGDPRSVIISADLLRIFAFGHQAVILFFVLSGFCIHFRQAEQISESERGIRELPRFDILGYLRRRLRRIVPPFYFALLVTAALDAAARFANPGFAAHLTGERFADLILAQHTSLRTLGGNLLFLQWLATPTYGNNTALWSLAYEFYLYLLYPIMLATRMRLGPARFIYAVAFCSAAAFAALHYLPGAFFLRIVEYWLCWSFGAYAAEVYVGSARMARAVHHPAIVAALTLAWLAAVKLRPESVAVTDTAGAMVCMLFLILLLRRYGEQRSFGAVEHLLARVGKFSYSLYLTHVPVLCLICACWFIFYDSKPTNPLIALLGVGLALAVGRVSYALVEYRTTNRP